MKLRKKTKKKLRIIFAVTMILLMLLPLVQYFIPQNSTAENDLLEAYYQSMMEAEEAEASDVPSPALEGTYIVSEVIDGNTITVLWGDEARNVKLIGVSVPESQKINATEYLKELVSEQYVGLEFDVEQEDEEGNLFAYAYLENMTQINELLLAEGFGEYNPSDKNIRYNDNFKSAEEAARESEIGLWSE